MQGGCFCGAVRYEVRGKPVAKGQCHCRACQYFSSGAPNLFMAVPGGGFRYVKGAPQTFRRDGPEAVATREFCGSCGTQIASRRDGLEHVILRIGTLDDPALFNGPRMAIFTAEAQAFHTIPKGVPAFEGYPAA